MKLPKQVFGRIYNGERVELYTNIEYQPPKPRDEFQVGVYELKEIVTVRSPLVITRRQRRR